MSHHPPLELRLERRWIHWFKSRDGRKLPVPCYAPPGITYTNPRFWATYEEATRRLRRDRQLGFYLGDSWAGIDIDDCRDLTTGELTPDAARIVHVFHCYTEISPSGTGVKLFFRIDPLGLSSHTRGGLEMYVGRRFFTVTNNPLPGTPQTIPFRTAEYQALAANEFGTTDDTRVGPSAKRYAYPGFPLEEFIEQNLKVTRHTFRNSAEVWEFVCPFHPQRPPEGHGAIASIKRYKSGNVVAGCFGGRCQSGFGPEGRSRWMFRDLIVHFDDTWTVDPGAYEVEIDENGQTRPSINLFDENRGGDL